MKNKRFKKTALCSAILLSFTQTQAAIITVDGIGGGACTLADAIQSANTDTAVGSCTAGSGADVLNVDFPITPQQILLDSAFGPSIAVGAVGLPTITSEITIQGNELLINADTSVENFRVLEVDGGGNLTLLDTTISGGDDGIGIGSGLAVFSGRVNVQRSVFTENNGAILIYDSINNSLSDALIHNNRTTTNDYAAGIFTLYAGLNITNSSISNNTIDFNLSPSNLSSAGGLSLIDSQVSVTSSTISGNSGPYGAGISIGNNNIVRTNLGKSLRLTKDQSNRGVMTSDVTLTNNTITNNKALFAIGGILDVADEGVITLQGNIISGNHDTFTDYADVFTFQDTTFNLDAHNIIGDHGEPGIYGAALGPTDLTFSNDTSDNLFPLIRTNGQWVHPLKPGSVAIDGMPLSCFGLVFDQEGKGRGIDGDGNGSFLCDIGALEHSLAIEVNDAPCTLINAIHSANSDSSVGGCRPGNGHDIIELEPNSLHSLDQVSYVLPIGSSYDFALPAVVTGITIDGNDATVEVADSFPTPLDIAVITQGGDLTINNSHFTKSTGFANVLTRFSDVTLIDSTITNSQGFGLAAVVGTKSAVHNSTVSGNNTLGSAFDSIGAGILTSSTNHMRIENSTITGNTAGRGAGLTFLTSLDATVTNSTISGNTATSVGAYLGDGSAGGVFVSYSEVSMTGLTVTGNYANILAGGLVVDSPSGTTASLQQSIISGNIAAFPAPDKSAGKRVPKHWTSPVLNILDQVPNVTNLGVLVDELAVSNPPTLVVDAHNIIGQSGDAHTSGVVLGATDVIPAGSTDTVIELALADNGGDTLSHNPVPGGIAIDVSNEFCMTETDQLGNQRRWDGDDNGSVVCDVGAVEYNSIPLNDVIFADGFETIIIRKNAD